MAAGLLSIKTKVFCSLSQSLMATAGENPRQMGQGSLITQYI